MNSRTGWIKPRKDGNYQLVEEEQRAGGKHLIIDSETVKATTELQEFLEEVPNRYVHDDGSYVVSEVLKATSHKIYNVLEGARKAYKQEDAEGEDES